MKRKIKKILLQNLRNEAHIGEGSGRVECSCERKEKKFIGLV
jgi:hypothetical protein